MRKPLLLSLAGSAILAGFSVAALPFSRGIFRVPRTPYDANEASFLAPAWILLQRAAEIVPRDVSVVVRGEPSDATNDSYLHRFAVALLPGRKIVPAAVWNVASAPEELREADYEVVVGKALPPQGSRLVLSIPEGNVWKRER